jgi:uncharacterized repeat protein (TIGR03803 family)
MLKRPLSNVARTVIAIAAALSLASSAAAAPKFKVLHSFSMGTGDGAGLYGSLALDEKENLYGMTAGGGTYGYGTAFELTSQRNGGWSETILHSFNCKVESCAPVAGLVLDKEGNLYGMGGSGLGDVFRLQHGSGGWTLTVIDDHGSPHATLALDKAGNLYGPTGNHGKHGEGAISELVAGDNWLENVLYSFCSRRDQKGTCLDGWGPSAGVTWGPVGVLYGTTLYGGDAPYSPFCGNTGCGVVYQLTPENDGSWKETVLHSFPATKSDGSVLYDGVVLDKKGNIYGATSQGGNTNCGVIFELSPKSGGKWRETILYDFPNLSDGCDANTLTFDQHGNLWGTAQGGTGCKDGGCGVVFKMTPDANGNWKYTVVHNFDNTDGDIPAAALTIDKHGNVYGTTELGGSGGWGVVFEITP